MELSWDEEKGLEMYVNKEKVASTKDYRTHPPLRITDHTVYLGRPNEDVSDGRYADAIVDELEYWFANRDILKTLNLIGDGRHERLLFGVSGLVTCATYRPMYAVCISRLLCLFINYRKSCFSWRNWC